MVALKVIIGGTFGYLHMGHRALLSKAFEIGDYIYIGLTSNAYVKRMKHPGIPTYSKRKALLEGFVKGLGKKFEITKLDDRFGPSATGDFDAIVVTKETLSAARDINRIRRMNDLKPLSIVRINYVLAADSKPISTTRILRGEISPEGALLHRITRMRRR